MVIEPWMKPRAYRHFDRPVDHERLVGLANSPSSVTSHAFLPLLHRTIEMRRFRAGGSVDSKKREIYYASHVDAAIYGRYAAALSERYEVKLRQFQLVEVVTAYRKLDGRCNIHFAKDAFECVRRAGACAVLCFDISGFFDSLDHRLLWEAWREVLGMARIPPDHLQVLKSVTRFSSVDLPALLHVLKLSERSTKLGSHTPYCSPRDFREKVRKGGIILRHQGSAGIPQGTPISAVLSNIYMLEFDRTISAWVSNVGGSYRRYSDDILVIVPAQLEVEAEGMLRAAIERRKLRLNEEKFEKVVFDADGSAQRPRPGGNQSVQYLGFTFDGRVVRVRSVTLARHHQRMRRAVRHAVFAARAAGNGSAPFRRDLFARFTHIGSKRTAVRYMLRAAGIMGEDAIRRQIRGNVDQVKSALVYYQTPRQHRSR